MNVLRLIVLGCFVFLAACRSLIFHPGPNDPGLREQYETRRFEIASHGQTIEGWWLDNPSARNDIVLLYFGGNAEDVLYTASSVAKLDARTVLFTNYRGYGKSTGKANQEALYEDGLAVYEYALSKGARPERVVVMGRSLGSGVASMLAGSREVKGAVLITPFDSISAVAADNFPKLSVSLLLGSSFLPSVEWARKAKAPALLLAAERDGLIPPQHARNLAEAWAGETEFHVLPAVGHNDISNSSDYYPLINEFLARGAPD